MDNPVIDVIIGLKVTLYKNIYIFIKSGVTFLSARYSKYLLTIKNAQIMPELGQIFD